MFAWSRVTRRGELWVVVSLVSGCWSSDPKVDGMFTDEEWAFLQTFKLPVVEPCAEEIQPSQCDGACALGKHLFFERALSGPIAASVGNDPSSMGTTAEAGKIACVDCHTTTKMFVDTRSVPGQVSVGTTYTMHNALGLVNSGYKRTVARDVFCHEPDAGPYCHYVFSWNGKYRSSGDVLDLALTKAMGNPDDTPDDVNLRLVNAITERHADEYERVFGTPDTTSPQGIATIHTNVVASFDTYERQINNEGSRFDQYIAGDVTALSDDEKRGLELFIGKAMCVDCHRPPLFSDLRFHNTGLPAGHAKPNTDNTGLADAHTPSNPDQESYLGQFLTQPLRNVNQTNPYMHAGQFDELIDVVNFYRNGGVADGYVGTRDPRIQPLDLDDDEVNQLVAFLITLDGGPVSDECM